MATQEEYKLRDGMWLKLLRNKDAPPSINNGRTNQKRARSRQGPLVIHGGCAMGRHGPSLTGRDAEVLMVGFSFAQRLIENALEQLPWQKAARLR
jgi:hypothetical protein